MGLIGEPLLGGARRASAADHPAILAHLLALDADDRYGRFATALSDAGIAAYVGRIDFARDIGVMLGGSEVLGFIHLAIAGDKAELGASVAAAWRRQGLARRLFRAATTLALAAGIRELHLAAAHPVARHILAGLGHPCRLQGGHPRGLVTLQTMHGPGM